MKKYHRGYLFDFAKLRGLCSVIPTVLSGDQEGVTILYADGKCDTVRLSYRSAINKIIRSLGCDYTNLAEIYKNATDKSQGIPIPMRHDKFFVLMELKVRNSDYKGQPAMGRICCDQIFSVERDKNKNNTKITLKNGHVFISQYSYETVIHRMILAVKFNAILNFELPQPNNEKQELIYHPVYRDILERVDSITKIK